MHDSLYDVMVTGVTNSKMLTGEQCHEAAL